MRKEHDSGACKISITCGGLCPPGPPGYAQREGEGVYKSKLRRFAKFEPSQFRFTNARDERITACVHCFFAAICSSIRIMASPCLSPSHAAFKRRLTHCFMNFACASTSTI